MNIPIGWFLRAWDRFGDWACVPLRHSGKITRFDVLFAISIVGVGAGAWYTDGLDGFVKTEASVAFGYFGLWLLMPKT
jgi:hypothetical protein